MAGASSMKTDDGRLIVVAGGSRCGKTTYVEKRVRGERRIVAWDPEDQWAQLRGWRRVTKRKELLDAMKTQGHMKIAYVAGGDLQEEFNFWAGVTYYAGRYIGPLVCIAEELADVTTSSKAPGNWGIILRRGLKRGITIYAISQRWAEADKTAIGNASEFVMFNMSSGDDVRYMTRKTRVPGEHLEALMQFEYINYDVATKAIGKNKLKF